MPELHRPVNPYRVTYACSKCGEPMHHTGIVFSTNPPVYPHECKCGHAEDLRSRYPKIVHREEDQAMPETRDDQEQPRTLLDCLVDVYCMSLWERVAERFAEELVSWAASKARDDEAKMDATGDDLEWIEIPFGDGLRLGFWGRWSEETEEDLGRAGELFRELFMTLGTGERCSTCGNPEVGGTYEPGEPCPFCEKEATVDEESEDRQEQGFGVPVRVKLGPHASQAEIYADRDGEEVNLLKLLPITKLHLDVDEPDARTVLTLKVETIEAFADKVKAQLCEDDLRWLAKLHGYALIPDPGHGLFKVHIICSRCGHANEYEMAGRVHVRCSQCLQPYRATVEVDAGGQTGVTVEPKATHAEVEPMRVSEP